MGGKLGLSNLKVLVVVSSARLCFLDFSPILDIVGALSVSCGVITSKIGALDVFVIYFARAFRGDVAGKTFYTFGG